MPNAKVLSEKQAIVAELTEKIQKASAGVLVDYKGITVEEDTALRRECRENGVDYAVVKNTLLRFAFNNTGLNELDDLLNGTTSLALCEEDVVAPARVMSDYAKKLNDKFEIKGGFMDGKPVSLETIRSARPVPGYYAGSHYRSGCGPEADRRKGRRARGCRCRGSCPRRRVIEAASSYF